MQVKVVSRMLGGVVLMCVTMQMSMIRGQLVRETYETCTAVEGNIARCGPGANCFIMNGVPTCHCVIDTATGLPLAGNPYKACTWDISGTWVLHSFIDEKTGLSKEIISPMTNQPFIIRLDRTDSILRTKYMMGAIFVVTALTGFAYGVTGRAFLDANDNTSVLFEHNEGFVDQNGRSIMLRSPLQDTTLIKMHNKLFDKHDLKGDWQKNDGSSVRISELKKPHDWPNYFSEMHRHWNGYWYNDSSMSSPILRLSMALFLDKTLVPEKIAFHTSARFVQTGWYGALRFGSSRIDIYSPADGKKIFTLKRKEEPLLLPSAYAATLQPTEIDVEKGDADLSNESDKIAIENKMEAQGPMRGSSPWPGSDSKNNEYFNDLFR